MIYWVCYRNHMPNLPLVTWTNPCQHLRLMVLRTCPTMPNCQEKTFSDICLQYAFTFVLNLHQRLVSADYFQDFINDCCQVDGQPFFNFLRLMKWLLFMCSTHFNGFQSIFFMGGYSVYCTICLEPQRKVRLHLNAADLGGFCVFGCFPSE